MANKFLTKEGKFVTKGGKFVTVQPPDPKDCICCGSKPPKYKCVSYPDGTKECVEDPEGEYDTSDCDGLCIGDCPPVGCRWVFKAGWTEWQLIDPEGPDEKFCEAFGCECEYPPFTPFDTVVGVYQGPDQFYNTKCGKPDNGCKQIECEWEYQDGPGWQLTASGMDAMMNCMAGSNCYCREPSFTPKAGQSLRATTNTACLPPPGPGGIGPNPLP